MGTELSRAQQHVHLALLGQLHLLGEMRFSPQLDGFGAASDELSSSSVISAD